MNKLLKLSTIALLAGGLASPIFANAQEDFSAIMVTDQGGVDDKSFNQSAWEGLQLWGEENGLEKGTSGFDYLESATDSDYITNLNTAVQSGFDLIYGVGFKLEAAINDVAQQYPDQQFAIIDSVVDQPNVASINFQDNEAAFLAGVAAASTTETNKIGFIGGVEGIVLDRFEAGFVAGAEAVNPDIEVTVEYVGSFADAPRGRQLAAAMYAADTDIIFQAAGDSGNGVFSEAKDLVSADPERNIWVIGADMDQDAEGIIEIDGEERGLTLTSTLKQIGDSIQLFTNETKAGNFEAGTQVFGLADGGVDLAEGNLSEEVLTTVNDYRQQIIDGEIEVPETPEN
ncbi:BMP family lipoprotein [Ruoffia tabacinasalis]|nr:BMP family protein [Ruoffia tabacinasalis]